MQTLLYATLSTLSAVIVQRVIMRPYNVCCHDSITICQNNTKDVLHAGKYINKVYNSTS